MNAWSSTGWTALHVAASSTQNPAIIEALLDAGADPNMRTAIEFSGRSRSDPMTPLEVADSRGRNLAAGHTIRRWIERQQAEDRQAAAARLAEQRRQEALDREAGAQERRRQLRSGSWSVFGSSPSRSSSARTPAGRGRAWVPDSRLPRSAEPEFVGLPVVSGRRRLPDPGLRSASCWRVVRHHRRHVGHSRTARRPPRRNQRDMRPFGRSGRRVRRHALRLRSRLEGATLTSLFGGLVTRLRAA